eukprot:scaffold14291_cov19-Tisochrysis_lutea.AAC.3
MAHHAGLDVCMLTVPTMPHHADYGVLRLAGRVQHAFMVKTGQTLWARKGMHIGGCNNASSAKFLVKGMGLAEESAILTASMALVLSKLTTTTKG